MMRRLLAFVIVCGAVVTLAAATSLLGPVFFQAMGVRAALGLAFVGFSAVAYKIAAGSEQPETTVGSQRGLAMTADNN